jgi:hypothetical protein
MKSKNIFLILLILLIVGGTFYWMNRPPAVKETFSEVKPVVAVIAQRHSGAWVFENSLD